LRAGDSLFLRRYFSGAAAEETFALAAGLAVVLAGAGCVVLSRRFLSRFLACARLRVFSRAFNFGIARTPDFQVF
jgi:hypothetical protein